MGSEALDFDTASSKAAPFPPNSTTDWAPSVKTGVSFRPPHTVKVSGPKDMLSGT